MKEKLCSDADIRLLHKYLIQTWTDFPFQNRKRSSQGYPRHHPFTTLQTLPNTTLHPPHLPAAFPFPCSIKASLAWVWTKDEESLSQKLFTHGAACLLPRCTLACKGGLWLNFKNRKIWGFFFHVFLEREHEKKESEGIPVVFVQHLIKTPQIPIFAEGNVWLRIKCWVASDVSVNGHAIKALRRPLNVGEGVPQEEVMWNKTLVIMCSVSHIEKGTFHCEYYVTSPREKNGTHKILPP